MPPQAGTCVHWTGWQERRLSPEVPLRETGRHRGTRGPRLAGDGGCGALKCLLAPQGGASLPGFSSLCKPRLQGSGARICAVCDGLPPWIPSAPRGLSHRADVRQALHGRGQSPWQGPHGQCQRRPRPRTWGSSHCGPEFEGGQVCHCDWSPVICEPHPPVVSGEFLNFHVPSGSQGQAWRSSPGRTQN